MVTYSGVTKKEKVAYFSSLMDRHISLMKFNNKDKDIDFRVF